MLNDPTIEFYRDAIKKRFQPAMTPYHYLANITDPRFMGARLSADMEDEAEAMLSNQYPDFYPALMKFKLKDREVFPERMFTAVVTESNSPSKWWQIVRMRNKKLSKEKMLPDEFCQYISKIHDCPASSGSIERIFSTFGFVWSKTRNRLGSDKAQKLVKIYRHYRRS